MAHYHAKANDALTKRTTMGSTVLTPFASFKDPKGTESPFHHQRQKILVQSQKQSGRLGDILPNSLPRRPSRTLFPKAPRFAFQQFPNVPEHRLSRSGRAPDIQNLQRVTNVEIALEQIDCRMSMGVKHTGLRLVYDFPARIKNALRNSQILEDFEVLRKAGRLPNAASHRGISIGEMIKTVT